MTAKYKPVNLIKANSIRNMTFSPLYYLVNGKTIPVIMLNALTFVSSLHYIIKSYLFYLFKIKHVTSDDISPA
jgi:hypothetical protein